MHGSFARVIGVFPGSVGRCYVVEVECNQDVASATFAFEEGRGVISHKLSTRFSSRGDVFTPWFIMCEVKHCKYC